MCWQRFRVFTSLQRLSPVFNETRPGRVLEGCSRAIGLPSWSPPPQARASAGELQSPRVLNLVPLAHPETRCHPLPSVTVYTSHYDAIEEKTAMIWEFHIRLGVKTALVTVNSSPETLRSRKA